MLTPSLFSHACELGPFLTQVGVNALPIRQAKGHSPKDLLQARAGNDSAMPSGDAPRQGVYDGIQRSSAPGNVISAFALFDVCCHHTASIGRADCVAKMLGSNGV